MMRTSFLLFTALSAGAIAAPGDDLALEATPFVRGYPAAIDIQGATARTPVYLGYSTAPLNPGSVCPPPLAGNCLDINPPQLVPVQPRSDANGDAALTFTVPPFLSDMHMQAATLAPNAEVSDALEVLVYDANPAGDLDDLIDDVTTLDVALDLDLNLDDTALTCLLFGACSCTASYEATGTMPVRNGQQLTFQGTWAQTASTCSSLIDTFLWTPANGAAYHTFLFNGFSTGIDTWVVHEDAADTAPVSNDFASLASAGQFAVEGLGVPYLGYSDNSFSTFLDLSVASFGLTIDVGVDADASITLGGLP